ncbi:MAG: hypothetical protein OXM54_08260 [Acidimicrobiaceae bacterium]|nr:hypothetical protein [Acidimicrobiaceae bacterium]MXW76786.1 hypothetical protein [Acidimicrobiaceae bacterium]
MSEGTDIEMDSADDNVDAKRPRRKRGTGFPVVSLSEAARILKEAGKYGFEHPTPAFASYMGHSTTNSGSFRQRLSAFRDWELITGRGDTLTMTEVARLIAMPTDAVAERRAMQQAFSHCDVFARLYDQTAKGQPLNRDRLGGRAVHELGVTPANASKFIESFVESALAAELAELNDDGDVVLWGPENGAAGEAAANETPDPPPPSPADSPTRGQVAERSAAAPTVRQLWPIDGGEIVFELSSDRALPAAVFAAIGDVVAQLETLASALSSEASTESHEGEIEV